MEITITNVKGDTLIVVHKNKVLKNKDLTSSNILSRSSKLLSFFSLHKHYKRHVGTIFYTTTLCRSLEVHQQAYRSTTCLDITQHKPKRLKEAIQNGISHVTMKKKVVYELPIPLTHATSVHHDDGPLPEVIQGKYLT
jgi:Fe-S cluster assembly scaffold protein SufB